MAALNEFRTRVPARRETSQLTPPQGLEQVGGPTALARSVFAGTIITNGGYDRDSAEKVLDSGNADLVAFGRAFISNPDLPERFRFGAGLNEGDHDTFYGGGEEAYIDYPSLADAS